MDRIMSKPTKRVSQKGDPEAGFLNIETKIQFDKETSYPYTLEKYMLNFTVAEVKNGILNMEVMKHVTERPDDLILSLIMPGENVGEAKTELELQDSKKMIDYLNDIVSCWTIRLKKKNC